jgi:hypothetical protein
LNPSHKLHFIKAGNASVTYNLAFSDLQTNEIEYYQDAVFEFKVSESNSPISVLALQSATSNSSSNISALDIIPGDIELFVGDSLPISLCISPLTALESYSSIIARISDNSVASLNEYGLVTGLSPGTTTIEAKVKNGAASTVRSIVVKDGSSSGYSTQAYMFLGSSSETSASDFSFYEDSYGFPNALKSFGYSPEHETAIDEFNYALGLTNGFLYWEAYSKGMLDMSFGMAHSALAFAMGTEDLKTFTRFSSLSKASAPQKTSASLTKLIEKHNIMQLSPSYQAEVNRSLDNLSVIASDANDASALPIISLWDGAKGHSLVPLGVFSGDVSTDISVWDPDSPMETKTLSLKESSWVYNSGDYIYKSSDKSRIWTIRPSIENDEAITSIYPRSAIVKNSKGQSLSEIGSLVRSIDAQPANPIYQSPADAYSISAKDGNPIDVAMSNEGIYARVHASSTASIKMDLGAKDAIVATMPNGGDIVISLRDSNGMNMEIKGKATGDWKLSDNCKSFSGAGTFTFSTKDKSNTVTLKPGVSMNFSTSR